MGYPAQGPFGIAEQNLRDRGKTFGLSVADGALAGDCGSGFAAISQSRVRNSLVAVERREHRQSGIPQPAFGGFDDAFVERGELPVAFQKRPVPAFANRERDVQRRFVAPTGRVKRQFGFDRESSVGSPTLYFEFVLRGQGVEPMPAVAGSLGRNADLLGVPERRRVIVAGACSSIQDAVRADERGPRADALRQMRGFAGIARRRQYTPALKLDI